LDTSLELNTIYNEDCLVTLSKMEDNSIDLIVTSPPYNKGHWLRNKSKTNGWIRTIDYESFNDDLPQEE